MRYMHRLLWNNIVNDGGYIANKITKIGLLLVALIRLSDIEQRGSHFNLKCVLFALVVKKFSDAFQPLGMNIEARGSVGAAWNALLCLLSLKTFLLCCQA